MSIGDEHEINKNSLHNSLITIKLKVKNMYLLFLPWIDSIDYYPHFDQDHVK